MKFRILPAAAALALACCRTGDAYDPNEVFVH